MDDDVAAHLEALESHVARLEAIVRIMLEQIENGTIEETAADIRAALPKIDD